MLVIFVDSSSLDTSFPVEMDLDRVPCKGERVIWSNFNSGIPPGKYVVTGVTSVIGEESLKAVEVTLERLRQ